MKFNADEFEKLKVTRKKPKRYYGNTVFTGLIALIALPLMLGPCNTDQTGPFMFWLVLVVPLMLWGQHKDEQRSKEDEE